MVRAKISSQVKSLEEQIYDLEPDLASVKAFKIQNEQKYQEIKKRLFQLFTQLSGQDGNFRILTHRMGTLMVMGRSLTPSEQAEEIDEDILKSQLSREDWMSISDEGERVLNQEKLYQAIADGRIKQSVVDVSTESVPQIAKLRYEKASAADKEQWEEEQLRVTKPA